VSVLPKPPRGPLYRLADFQEQYGLADASLMVDLKALMGDVSDNIPGVKGVGEKTAARLVAAWGPLEQVLAALDSVPAEQQQQVRAACAAPRACLAAATGPPAAVAVDAPLTPLLCDTRWPGRRPRRRLSSCGGRSWTS
jgi:5'-3' exonuclease